MYMERAEAVDKVMDELSKEAIRVGRKYGLQNIEETLRKHYPIGCQSLAAIENELSGNTPDEKFWSLLTRYRFGYLNILEKLDTLYGGGI